MKIGISSIIYSTWSFLSKISGYIRDLFLASYLGAGVLSDIFFIALKMPNTFRRSISEETFNSAYIPIHGQLSDQIDKQKKYQFARKILILLCLFFIPFTIIIEIFMPSITRLIASGINNPEDLALLTQVARIIFPYLIFIVLSSVFVAILNANNKFALASGLPIILNISIVTSILLFPYFEYSKIIFLSWSVIIGGMMQTVFLFLSIEKSFWKSFFAFKRYYTSSKQFFILIWPVFFASTFMQINVLIGMLIASFEPGAVSYLYFAERIYYIPLTLIAIAISTVLIPNLSNTVRKTSRLDANVMQLQAYKYCVFTVIPATFVLIGISDELIKLLFERGEFTAEDSMQASLALKIFLIGLPAATFSKILTPYFYAIEQPKIILKVAFYTFVLNVFLTISLFWFVGFIAVPLALSISAFWNLFLLLKEHKSSKLFILEKSQFLYLARYLFLALMIYLVISIIDLLGFGDHYLVGGIFTKGLLSFVLWLSFISIYDIEIRDLFIAYIKEKRYKT